MPSYAKANLSGTPHESPPLGGKLSPQVTDEEETCDYRNI